ncbi:pantetheine-phosphate adenylyltransferase family protein-like protein [Leptodontidium sp. MPI-SDFR-AT-0119]|nr:pantetheine-phosphate adenylyltransferase family protein-like protein [Leptodontidium sp. MPI-SDFR-AT-0119]
MPAALKSLLLLPPPPSPVSAATLSAAYRPSVTATVSSLGQLSSSSQLLVVLPCPSLHRRLDLPRSQIYDEVQKLLGGVYSLICIVCAKLGVDVDSDTPGSIDARVILLDYTKSTSSRADDDAGPGDFLAGPIVDLQTFALTRRHWNKIFSVEGEEGQKLLASYVEATNRNSPPLVGNVELVKGGVSMVQKISTPVHPVAGSSTAHRVVAVGGTFDHLHVGHKLLLTATALLLQPDTGASLVNRRLIVGITGDELLKNKKYAEYLNSWKQRQEDVVEFLLSVLSFTRSNREEAIQITSFNEPVPNGHAIHTTIKDCSITIECAEIQDPFGPTITDESVTALVVSGETRSGGQAVNDKRLEKGWKALEVFEVDVLDAEDVEDRSTKAEDFASKISSTAIRKRRAEVARTSSL